MSESETASQTGTGDVPSGLYVPPQSKSAIWKYFKLKKDDVEKDKTWSVCNLCPNKSLAYNGATTTMWNHAQAVHFITKPKVLKQAPITTVKELQPKVQIQDVDLDIIPSTSAEPAPSTSRGPRQISIQKAFARDDTQSICKEQV